MLAKLQNEMGNQSARDDWHGKLDKDQWGRTNNNVLSCKFIQRQRFHIMTVDKRTMRALETTRIIREILFAIIGIGDWFSTLPAFNSSVTTWRCCKDIIPVQRSDLVARAVPRSITKLAFDGVRFAFQAVHANGGEVQRLRVQFQLDTTGCCEFPGRQKEGAIEKWVVGEHGKVTLTHHAIHRRLAVREERLENEGAWVVVLDVVVHFDVARVDLLSRQNRHHRCKVCPPWEAWWVALFPFGHAWEGEEIFWFQVGPPVWRFDTGRALRRRLTRIRELSLGHFIVGIRQNATGRGGRDQNRLVVLFLLPFAFDLLKALLFARRLVVEVFPEVPLTATTGTALVNEVVAFLRPYILLPLLVRPTPRTANASQKRQNVFFESFGAFAVHQTAVLTLLVVTNEVDRIPVRRIGRQKTAFRITALGAHILVVLILPVLDNRLFAVFWLFVAVRPVIYRSFCFLFLFFAERHCRKCIEWSPRGQRNVFVGWWCVNCDVPLLCCTESQAEPVNLRGENFLCQASPHCVSHAQGVADISHGRCKIYWPPGKSQGLPHILRTRHAQRIEFPFNFIRKIEFCTCATHFWFRVITVTLICQHSTLLSIILIIKTLISPQ